MRKLLFVSVICAAVAAAPKAFQATTAARTAQAAPAAPTLKAGDPAPDFSLMGSDGKTHRLADFKGKFVVLAWFPKAFTGGCTQECHSITENGDVLKAFDVTYFMVSVDDADTNKKFAEQEKANFTMLGDPDKAVATAYGVLGRSGVANRWTFYIGPDGKLLKVDTDGSKHTLTAGADLAASLTELGVPKKK